MHSLNLKTIIMFLLCIILATHWHDTKGLVHWVKIIRFHIFLSKRVFCYFYENGVYKSDKHLPNTKKHLPSQPLISENLTFSSTWFVQVSNFKQPIEYAKKKHIHMPKTDFNLEFCIKTLLVKNRRPLDLLLPFL